MGDGESGGCPELLLALSAHSPGACLEERDMLPCPNPSPSPPTSSSFGGTGLLGDEKHDSSPTHPNPTRFFLLSGRNNAFSETDELPAPLPPAFSLFLRHWAQ